MSLPFIVWLALAGVVGLVWIARAVGLRSSLAQRQILDSRSYDGPPDDLPRISVLVAAKDEEDNIETCVRSLLAQDYPNFEVIAIDDRSTDKTPQILAGLREEGDHRLRVVTVETLREGWFGKNNAMREGINVSTGDWLCLTDADCKQTSEKTLSMAISEATAHKVDFLSITPVLEAKTAWERVIQPVCAMVLIFWFLPERVNDSRKKTAYANGAFMLMRRSCYNAIGGHERVRAEVNEDIHMARLAKEMGLGLRVVENDDLYITRMYPTLHGAWRGWSRIFFGCLGTIPRLAVAAGLVATLSVLPGISLLAAWIGWGAFGNGVASPWGTMAAAWSGVFVANQMVTRRMYHILGISPLWSVTYAIGALFTLGVLFNAMLKVTGAGVTTWRGTAYRGTRVLGESSAAGGLAWGGTVSEIRKRDDLDTAGPGLPAVVTADVPPGSEGSTGSADQRT